MSGENVKKQRREVVHIRESTGPRGGKAWELRLSCGHYRYVRRATGKRRPSLFRRLQFAPKTAQCLVCP